MRLSGWGHFPQHDAALSVARDESRLQDLIRRGHAIARGNGRSYGDSAVSIQNTIHMAHFDRFLGFDPETGLLAAESGVLLSDIIQSFLPRGWFPYVTPGTKYVTLGGLIAADVHGKNHHREGGFGSFVEWLDLMDGEGRTRRCSRLQHRELFEWTIGGMGLTGIILRAAFRLRKVETAWICQTLRPARCLSETIEVLEEEARATYSVAWIDCLKRGNSIGRSLIMSGEHATIDDIDPRQRQYPLSPPRRKKIYVPFTAPRGLLNSMTVAAFNGLCYGRGSMRAGDTVVDYDRFFYPLDTIDGWNRIYGRGGFVQFQCVLPASHTRSGLNELLASVSNGGAASFLAVLKKLGPSSGGISFPMQGYTLAMDFPARPHTLALMPKLQRIAIDHGGRFYLAKDACLTSGQLSSSDKRIADFRSFRERIGVTRIFESAQSQRLEI